MRSSILFSTILAFLLVTASYAFAVDHSGTVLETASGGGYTYIKVKEGKNVFWAAGPTTQVKKGAVVNFSEQVWMPNFKSQALNRTFDKILFESEIRPGAGKAVKPAPKKQVQAKQVKKVKQTKQAKKPRVAERYTVEQIFDKGEDLKGHLVQVQGKVVKVSEGIMGRNWVHVVDGTGIEGGNKLIFTSPSDTAAVGDQVMAQGILETDKDFGYGYFYPIIVEDSVFAK